MRAICVLGAALLPLLSTQSVTADTALVPADMQAELLSKLAGYDRNFEARAGSQAVILLVVKPKNPQSNTSAAIMRSALGRLNLVGGLPHREQIVLYEGAEALAKLCRSQRAAVVYLTPGFDDQLEPLGGVLSDVDILSLAAVPDYVPRGIVLGFELVSGKPKIVLNLPQAKKQNVSFKADVLKLMKVYR